MTQNAEPARAVRDVTPDNMTAGPKVTGTLARVGSPAAADQPAKARTERLFNADRDRGRNDQSADQRNPSRRHHGAGLRRRAAAKAQPRGRAGAWRAPRCSSFIRGRAIECELPAGADTLPDPATCVVGGENISEWLVAQGWAKRSGDSFEDAEKNAREAKLGLWSDSRPDQAAEVASTSG